MKRTQVWKFLLTILRPLSVVCLAAGRLKLIKGGQLLRVLTQINAKLCL